MKTKSKTKKAGVVGVLTIKAPQKQPDGDPLRVGTAADGVVLRWKKETETVISSATIAVSRNWLVELYVDGTCGDRSVPVTGFIEINGSEVYETRMHRSVIAAQKDLEAAVRKFGATLEIRTNPNCALK